MKLLKIRTKIDTILMVVPDNYDRSDVIAHCYNANDNVSAPKIVQEINLTGEDWAVVYKPYFGNEYKDTEFE